MYNPNYVIQNYTYKQAIKLAFDAHKYQKDTAFKGIVKHDNTLNQRAYEYIEHTRLWAETHLIDGTIQEWQLFKFLISNTLAGEAHESFQTRHITYESIPGNPPIVDITTFIQYIHYRYLDADQYKYHLKKYKNFRASSNIRPQNALQLINDFERLYTRAYNAIMDTQQLEPYMQQQIISENLESTRIRTLVRGLPQFVYEAFETGIYSDWRDLQSVDGIRRILTQIQKHQLHINHFFEQTKSPQKHSPSTVHAIQTRYTQRYTGNQYKRTYSKNRNNKNYNNNRYNNRSRSRSRTYKPYNTRGRQRSRTRSFSRSKTPSYRSRSRTPHRGRKRTRTPFKKYGKSYQSRSRSQYRSKSPYSRSTTYSRSPSRTKTSYKSNKFGNNRKKTRKGNCFRCGKDGHFAAECGSKLADAQTWQRNSKKIIMELSHRDLTEDQRNVLEAAINAIEYAHAHPEPTEAPTHTQEPTQPTPQSHETTQPTQQPPPTIQTITHASASELSDLPTDSDDTNKQGNSTSKFLNYLGPNEDASYGHHHPTINMIQIESESQSFHSNDDYIDITPLSLTSDDNSIPNIIESPQFNMNDDISITQSHSTTPSKCFPTPSVCATKPSHTHTHSSCKPHEHLRRRSPSHTPPPPTDSHTPYVPSKSNYTRRSIPYASNTTRTNKYKQTKKQRRRAKQRKQRRRQRRRKFVKSFAKYSKGPRLAQRHPSNRPTTLRPTPPPPSDDETLQQLTTSLVDYPEITPFTACDPTADDAINQINRIIAGMDQLDKDKDGREIVTILRPNPTSPPPPEPPPTVLPESPDLDELTNELIDAAIDTAIEELNCDPFIPSYSESNDFIQNHPLYQLLYYIILPFIQYFHNIINFICINSIINIFHFIQFLLFCVSIVNCNYIMILFHASIIYFINFIKLTQQSIDYIYMFAQYKGKTWVEDTTCTSQFQHGHTWRVRAWARTLTNKIITLFLFADTGASISAINAEFAITQDYTISERKSPLMCRVANGKYMKLTKFVRLPIVNSKGKFQFYHTFYLLPKLQHNYLASYYLLRKLKMPFPTESPLLNPHAFEHKEQPQEAFGTFNNWSKHLNARTKQSNISKNPHFKPHSVHTVTSKTKHVPKPSKMSPAPAKTSKPSPAPTKSSKTLLLPKLPPELSKPLLSPIDMAHDYSAFHPTAMAVTPYETYLDATINPISYYSANINKLTAVAIENYRIPIKTYTVSDHMLHISNYVASKEELEKAKQLAHDRPLKKIDLAYINKIDKLLHTKMTKLIYVQYSHIFAKFQSDRTVIPNYEFKIDLIDSAPARIFIPQYPLSEQQRLVVLHQSQKNVESGLFIPDTKSPHNVPIIIVPKKGGRLRLAFALQLLNRYTKVVQSHIPSYNYIFEKLRGQGLYTVTDLKNFFECIKLRPSDQPLVHVTTPIGEYNLTAGTYGYRNISAIAQDIANAIVRPFNNAVAFVDDIVVKHSPNATPEELYSEASKLIESLSNHGVLCNPEKTWFFVPEIEYLGYIFNQLGTMPRPDYIQKVIDFKKPQNTTDVKSFLAIINYISRYVYDFARIAHPIQEMVQKGRKWNWGHAQQEAFEQIKERVSNVKLLAHPTPDGEFLVQTDSSQYAIGAVLYQKQYNKETKTYRWEIIEFYSKALDKHMYDQPIQVKECLAIVHALNHWRHFLLRKLFYVDTDHKNLIYLYDSDEQKASGMKKKQIFVTMRYAIAQYHFKIAHIAGTKIPFADYLSRDGNDTYRKMNLNIITMNPHKHKFTNDKWDSYYEFLNTFDYINYIRHSNVEHPPSINYYNHDTFQDRCYYLYEQSLLYSDQVKTYIINDFIKNSDYRVKTSHSAQNRWLSTQPTHTQPTRNTRESTNDSTSTEHINSIENANKPFILIDCPSDKSRINSMLSISNIHDINDPNRHSNYNIIEPNINLIYKSPKSSKVSFNLNKSDSHESPNHSYNPQFKIKKSILKLRDSKDKLVPSNLKYDTIIPRTSYMIDQFIKNHTYYEKSINQNLRLAMYNRFKLQKSNITSKTIHELSIMSILTMNNYNTDDTGRRRGTRKRKKSFYATFSEEQYHLNAAKPKKHTNNTAQPHPTPDIPHTKAKKFNLTPERRNKLFKTLFNDVYYFKRIDSLLSPKKLRICQLNDPISCVIIDFINKNIKLTHDSMKNLCKHYNFIYKLAINKQFYLNKLNILCIRADKKYLRSRIVVPAELIPVALTYIHKSEHFNHPGINQTRKLIESKFFWYGYPSDIIKYISQCDQCQLGKGHQLHRYGLLRPIATSQHNEVVHFDFLGPIHKSLSILVMVDNYTGYVMLIATHGQTANDVINALWNVWRPIHGLPQKLLTDRGKGFIAEINQKFYQTFGIRKLFTSSYHPETNAKAERIVQEVKKAYRMLNITLDGDLTDSKRLKSIVNEIKLLLPSIQYSLNQKLKSFSPVSPNMLLFGKQMNDPIDNAISIELAMDKLNEMKHNKSYHKAFDIIARVNKSLQLMRDIYNRDHKRQVYRMAKNFNKHKLANFFQPGDKVVYYIGNRSYTNIKLRPRYSGPFTVVSISHNTAKIHNDDTNDTLVCHIKMLKRYIPKYFTPEYIYDRTNKQKINLDKIHRPKKNETSRKSKQSTRKHKHRRKARKHRHNSLSKPSSHALDSSQDVPIPPIIPPESPTFSYDSSTEASDVSN